MAKIQTFCLMQWPTYDSFQRKRATNAISSFTNHRNLSSSTKRTAAVADFTDSLNVGFWCFVGNTNIQLDINDDWWIFPSQKVKRILYSQFFFNRPISGPSLHHRQNSNYWQSKAYHSHEAFSISPSTAFKGMEQADYIDRSIVLTSAYRIVLLGNT